MRHVSAGRPHHCLRAVLLLVILQLLGACGCDPQSMQFRTRARYTEISLKFPGLECSWRRHDRVGKDERSDHMTVTPSKKGDTKITIHKNSMYGDFEITDKITRSSVQAWGGSMAQVGDFTKSIRVSDVSFQFVEDKIDDVFIQGYYYDQNLLRIERNGKTVTWPCSRQALIEVFGEPLSTTEVEREVGGP